MDETMQMIEKNIFRPLPNVKKGNLNFAETGIDQEEEMDPAWPHLQGIYEFFLQLVVNESVEVKQLKFYVTAKFVQEFLDLFDSEESVERDYLKNILHKLYAKVSQTHAEPGDLQGLATWSRHVFALSVILTDRESIKSS
jgi:serine/threonine-protein phosphatase 2A regulatory subunit B'